MWVYVLENTDLLKMRRDAFLKRDDCDDPNISLGSLSIQQVTCKIDTAVSHV